MNFAASAAQQDETAATEEFQEAMAEAEASPTEVEETADDAMPTSDPGVVALTFEVQTTGLLAA